MTILHWFLLVPVITGSVFSCISVVATWWFVRRALPAATGTLPPVSVLKPVYGLDRDLEANLASFLCQDYPEYEVVFSLQRDDDPARPMLERLVAAHPRRARLVVADCAPTLNGKVQNMVIALGGARHDVLVISDSDVRAPPAYLRTLVAPLAEPGVGYVCSRYRVTSARTLGERLELLAMNADFMPGVIFAYVTDSAVFCLGASIAVRRRDLDAVGGMASFADYLVEDHELGRRLRARGMRVRLVSLAVDMLPDYPRFGDWWTHQVYWDQNTRAANATGFALTVLQRGLPFALLHALSSAFSPGALGLLGIALALRLGCAAAVAALLGDRAVLANLGLLPLRDVLALASWLMAHRRRSFVWRGHEFGLSSDGRIVPRDPAT